MNSKKYWYNKLSELDHKEPLFYKTEIGKSQFEGKTLAYELSTETVSQLEMISQNNSKKQHLVMLAAMGMVMQRYSCKNEIFMGTPVYKDASVEVDKNALKTVCLPLKIVFDDEMVVKELLNRVKDEFLHSVKHQSYAVEKVIQKWFAEDDGSYNEPVEVVLMLDDLHAAEHLANKKYNLLLNARNVLNKCIIDITYNCCVYNETTVLRVLENFERALIEMGGKLNSKVSEIEILTDAQVEQIRTVFNTYEDLELEDITLHECFENQVEKTPENIAVSDTNSTLTYEALNEKANQLAWHLRKLGIHDNDSVGIMLEPSVSLSVAIFAILKAGAHFVPLDPHYPVNQLNYMVKDSKLRYILVSDGTHGMELENTSFIDLNDPLIQTHPTTNLSKVSSDQLAYIIYTSGSTGNPKGVMIDHQSVSKTIRWRQHEYAFTPQDVVLQTLSYSFDGFIGGFFTPLISGAQIILASNEERKDVTALMEYLRNRSVTHLHSVPALMNVVIERVSQEGKHGLRTITVGGEKPPASLINECEQQRIELINEYGPTENTIITTILRNLCDPRQITVGKPVYDTEIFILDARNRITPIGVPGEICIGGGRLARGYLNNEELTKEKFESSHHTGGKPMYRTGDLGFWSEDGNLNLVGRSDFQVKIRGFRIELGEIESKIMELPSIQHAVVVDRLSEADEKYLVAYYVLKENHTAMTESELKANLEKKLPGHMMPQAFMQLEKIPVTSNGKLDRKNLPEVQVLENTEIPYVAPQTDDEKYIVQVWKKVLNTKQDIGLKEDFFKIGGDSIKAIRCASLLSDRFQIAINDIYKHPTIEALTDALKATEKTLAQRLNDVKQQVETFQQPLQDQNPKGFEAFELHMQQYHEKIQAYDAIDLRQRANYDHVLLTGATGYVGSYLLKELLEESDVHVYTLVRGKNEEDSKNRLQEKLRFYFDESLFEKYAPRIHVIKGDITQLYLGLEKNIYEGLSHKIECILHSAAFVKHYGDEEQFNNINVIGTKNILEFATNGITKDVNHISTTSVNEGKIEGLDVQLFSEWEMDMGQRTPSLYSQSKLTSEKLVMEATQKGIHAKIFRLGNVTFDSRTGNFQENIEDNAVYSTLKAFVKLNAFPEIHEKTMNFSYVDQLAKSIVLLMDRSNLKNEVFHIYNPYLVSMNEIGSMIRDKYDALEIVDLGKFINHLEQFLEDPDLRISIDTILMYFDLSEESTDIVTVNDKTTRLLKRLDFEWSEMNLEMSRKMMDYWEQSRFIS